MSRQEDESASLIKRAKQRDNKAFDKLYALHEEAVRGFIRVRVYSDADAQDLAQKVRHEIYEKIAAYNPGYGEFRAFVIRRAWFRVMDYYRHHPGELLVGDLVERFPEFEHETEEDLIAHFASAFSPSPEDEAIRVEQHSKVYAELLRLTFHGSSPPHQLIVFGFILLEWKPREVVAELSDSVLRKLEESLETEYVKTSQLPADSIKHCFAQLRTNMDDEFREVVREPRTLETYPGLHDRIVGDTILRDYYTGKKKGQADEISAWCFQVKQRVWKAVQALTEGTLYDLLHEVD